MGANDKVAATFHPDDQAASAVKVGEEGQRILAKYRVDNPEGDVLLESEEVADVIVEGLRAYMEEAGNDLRTLFVDEVTQGGRIVTVDWSNGQRFEIEVMERRSAS